MPLFSRLPRWFVLLLGVAAAALAIQGLLAGVVETPSSHAFLRTRIARAEQPGLYWALVSLYAAAAAVFLGAAWQRFRGAPDAADGAPATPEPSPPRGLARAFAWAGVLGGVLLVAAAVAAHLLLDPIISLPFVAVFGGAGLTVGLSALGYLVTGRLQ